MPALAKSPPRSVGGDGLFLIERHHVDFQVRQECMQIVRGDITLSGGHDDQGLGQTRGRDCGLGRGADGIEEALGVGFAEDDRHQGG